MRMPSVAPQVSLKAGSVIERASATTSTATTTHSVFNGWLR